MSGATPSTPGSTVELASTRRRPRWLPLVATVAFVVLCIAAGNWQRARLHEKEALRVALDAAERAPAVALPQGVSDWRPWRYRHVVVTGRYQPERQFLLDNRVHNGRVGFDVVTPLATDGGARVLVDRGFVPAGPDRAMLPVVPAPAGDVTVEGRVELPVRGYLFGNPPPRGPLWAHLDVDHYAATIDAGVLPIVLQATGGVVDAALARDWPAPDLGTEKHLGYMVQWYTFAVMAAGFWMFFAVRQRLRRA